ncbi:hypothetical protein KFL_001800040 [Klebsormidium nitens]|uniref:Uncharacterized protein n=1 Tax=Klebsormidium nitens TaxID=105231 RepID=A0A1Y1I653_KLENI|nr:hypothetical protein KFL_001800040 [Klebsormidium nitens]|eukprot:GAQ84196.1 hypothetical protein KFL_001800040 [Klebsormidium nitens]
MSAQRTLASTLRRLGQERQLVDFVLRSQSIANDASAADAVPAALGATDQRRSGSPFRGGLFDLGASGSDDLEPIGQSLFGDSAGGGSWWTSPAAPAPTAQPVPSLSQSFAELNRAAASAAPRPVERPPQVTQSSSLNRFITPMLHGLGGAAPAAIRGGAEGTFGQPQPNWLFQEALMHMSALSEWQGREFGKGMLRSLYSEMGVSDVDTRSR